MGFGPFLTVKPLLTPFLKKAILRDIFQRIWALELSTSNVVDYRELLKREFHLRQEKNIQYSLRAFARDLQLDPGQLSNVINGKKHISLSKAASIARRITDHPIKAQLFYHAVEYSQTEGEELRGELETKIIKLIQEKVDRKATIADEEFETISAWYHIPLLQLTSQNKIPVTRESAASYLGIKLEEANLALERLKRLGFVSKTNGVYKKVKSLITTTDVPSLAIKQFHQAMMEKARIAMFHQAFKKRYFSSLTIQIPQDKLEDFKKIIHEAEAKIEALATQYKNEKSNEVYHYSSQLFSLKNEDFQ